VTKTNRTATSIVVAVVSEAASSVTELTTRENEAIGEETTRKKVIFSLPLPSEYIYAEYLYALQIILSKIVFFCFFLF